MITRTVVKPLLEPLASRDETLAVVMHLNEVMDALLKIVEHETALVRAGRLQEATKLEESKNRLAQLYLADATRLNASTRYLEEQQPALIADLRQRHVAFHANLQINLTVLATAHAVAEGIVRGVSAEVTQKARPQVYGASGRAAGVAPRQSQPIAVSRIL